MLFLLEETLHVEGKWSPDLTVHGNRMFPVPTGVDNSTRSIGDSLVLVLCSIDSKLKFCHNIATDEIIENASKRADWLFALDTIKPVVVLARRAVDYIMGRLPCCNIQLSKQRELTAVMQAYRSKDGLMPSLAPLRRAGLSFQDTIIAMLHIYPSIDETAEKVCMSRPTFIRHFKQHLGKTLKTWVGKVKGEALFKVLFDTGDTLEQIANQFKSSSMQRLSTFCKETLGDTPGEIGNGVVRSEQTL